MCATLPFPSRVGGGGGRKFGLPLVPSPLLPNRPCCRGGNEITASALSYPDPWWVGRPHSIWALSLSLLLLLPLGSWGDDEPAAWLPSVVGGKWDWFCLLLACGHLTIVPATPFPSMLISCEPC